MALGIGLSVSSCVGGRIYSKRSRMLMELPREVQTAHAMERLGRVVQDQENDGKEPLSPYGDSLYVLGTDHEGTLLSLDLSPVTVTAPLKMVPERQGKVDLDFSLTLPRTMLFSSSRLILVPRLLLEDGNQYELAPLDLFGKSFLQLQDRSYYLFERYLDRKGEYTLQDRERIFDRFVRFPFLEGTRLDTLFLSDEPMTLSYSQTVETTGLSRTLLRIALEVRAEALDGSSTAFPLRDTLEYRISSLLGFLDQRIRYKMVVRDKHLKERRSFYLQFKTGSGVIDLSVPENLRAAEQMVSVLEQVPLDAGLSLDSLSIEAWASPEGSEKGNLALSARRAEWLRRFLEEHSGAGAASLSVRPMGEDMDGLARAVLRDSVLLDSQRQDVLEVLENSLLSKDEKEGTLRRRYPSLWRHLEASAFPSLRRVDLVLSYNRLEQKKDTVHLEEVNQEYMQALEELRSRRYASALEVLQDYRDQNCVIGMLSLGRDREALEVLENGNVPPGALWYYLHAVALSRLDRMEEARQAFQMACQMDESWKLRASLDPEVSQLQ